MHRIAHFQNIVGAQALLTICQPPPCRVRFTEEERHERVHPCGGEEHTGVLFRNQGSTADNGMTMLLHRAKKRLS
jgi:hypothetical protein